MKQTALITGASSGIGRELAIIHASKGRDLVITARREKELEEVKHELEKKYHVQVHIIIADLSDPMGYDQIVNDIKKNNIQIEYLINNAGFGGHGLFHERDWKKDQAMINVNIMSLTALTRLILPDMIKNRKGRILNISSGAGFIPGPLQAVYYASKAYVNSFSQAVAEEVSGTGVTVTVFCPGATDTGFAKEANVEDVSMFSKADTATDVAKAGYKAMEKEKLVEIYRWSQKIMLNYLVHFMPRKTVLKASKKTLEKNNRA